MAAGITSWRGAVLGFIKNHRGSGSRAAVLPVTGSQPDPIPWHSGPNFFYLHTIEEIKPEETQMEPGRECFMAQEPGLARAEEFQTRFVSTQGSLPALPPRSGYLEQIHGVGKPDPPEGSGG